MLTFSNFVLFLYEEKCLAMFFDNIRNDPLFGERKDLKSIVKRIMRVTPSQFLLSAFNWYLSPEGHEFWAAINDKWQQVVFHER